MLLIQLIFLSSEMSVNVWYNPINKIISKVIEIIIPALILEDNIIIVIGNNNTISTWKFEISNSHNLESCYTFNIPWLVHLRKGGSNFSAELRIGFCTA